MQFAVGIDKIMNRKSYARAVSRAFGRDLNMEEVARENAEYQIFREA